MQHLPTGVSTRVIDLTAYLRRIGFEGAPRVDLATLQQLALRHPMAIAFENLDAFTGRAVSLDLEDVEAKLVARHRGGWCFEHNLLLGEALRAIGFDVTDLAGRVVLGREPDAIAPRTHRLLQVRLEGNDWIADAGFGGLTLTGVLDLHAQAAQATPHGQFRLRPLGGEQLAEYRSGESWLPLFRFDLHPQQRIDFEAANFQLVHDPASHFTRALRVSRIEPNGRRLLRGFEFEFHPLVGEPRRETLGSPDAVLAVLRDAFGIPVEEVPSLASRLSAPA